jgi:hypothetical protein
MVGSGVIALSAAATVDHCVSPTGAKRVRVSDAAVITVERHGDTDLLDGGTQSATWRGCARRRGEQVVLERGTSAFSGGHVATRFRLADEFVAYLAEDWTESETTDSVTVVSLATGQRWRSDAINTLTGDGTGFAELAVNRDGDATWIRVTIADDGHRRWRLFLRRQDRVTLRAESRTALTKLRLSTHRLSWSERGKTRTRRL